MQAQQRLGFTSCSLFCTPKGCGRELLHCLGRSWDEARPRAAMPEYLKPIIVSLVAFQGTQRPDGAWASAEKRTPSISANELLTAQVARFIKSMFFMIMLLARWRGHHEQGSANSTSVQLSLHARKDQKPLRRAKALLNPDIGACDTVLGHETLACRRRLSLDKQKRAPPAPARPPRLRH